MKNKFKPTVEALEDRMAPATLFPEFKATVSGAGYQGDPDVASSSYGGLHAVVWEHRYAGTNNTNIYARLIDSTGETPASKDILVAGSYADESNPAVAMDDSGNWVVVYQRRASANNHNLAVAQFGPDGERLNGGNFTPFRSRYDETNPDVASAGNGDFVVTYSRSNNIYGRMYNADRSLVRDLKVATSSLNEHDARVARNGAGIFSVAYVVDAFPLRLHGSGVVRMSRFTADGRLMHHRIITGYSERESPPSVSMNANGNTLVGWYHVSDAGTSGDWVAAARLVSHSGAMGPVRWVAVASEHNSDPPGTKRMLWAPNLTLRQNGTDDQIVVVYADQSVDPGGPPATNYTRTSYEVYDYSTGNRLAGGAVGVVDADPQTAFVTWHDHNSRALITWMENDDIHARRLAL